MKSSDSVKEKPTTKTKKSKASRTSELLSRARNCRRRVFTISEDKTIIKCVSSSKFNNNWEAVAKLLPWRTPRQCRDRWTYYLSPTNNLSPFSIEEDLSIVQKVNEYGTKWALISKILPGRSDNSIKNRWYSKLKGKCTINPEGMYILDLQKLAEPSSRRRKCEASMPQQFDSNEIHNQKASANANYLEQPQSDQVASYDNNTLEGQGIPLNLTTCMVHSDSAQNQIVDSQKSMYQNPPQSNNNVEVWDGDVINWATDIFNFANESDFILF